jgi:hypothetical protein
MAVGHLGAVLTARVGCVAALYRRLGRGLYRRTLAGGGLIPLSVWRGVKWKREVIHRARVNRLTAPDAKSRYTFTREAR